MPLANNMPMYVNIHGAVPDAVEAFHGLSVEDRLGLLWMLHRHMGDSVASSIPKSVATATAPGATAYSAALPNATARVKLSGTLMHQVATLPAAEQRCVMHDLISGINTPLTRSYGCLSSNSKLAFWHQWANWMNADDSVERPAEGALSTQARAVFNQVMALEFSQKIAFLRLVVGKMGINPLTA